MDVQNAVDRDLESAGSAIQAFAPGGLLGLVVGGLVAMLALIFGQLKRVWRRREGAHSPS
jgi:hypothetical protein